MSRLSTTDFLRYKRQIMLPDWNLAVQERLCRAAVLLAGAGGLGCPGALNLAAAGVGRIRICDPDTVEWSNLNRQSLYTERDIGSPKASAARALLSALNSSIVVEAVKETLTEENVDRMASGCQVIIDCLDNFPGRYVLNSYSARTGTPLIHGAVWGTEGRVAFLHPPKTPCLACMYPEVPPQEEVPVLGAVTCSTGALQAMEAIKYLTGTGELLMGRMLVTDLSSMYFQQLELRKRPGCPVCG
jgi:adenylyltransferase/sulfurtransferase